MSETEASLELIERHIAGTLTAQESVRLQAMIVADPKVAEALALACELDMFLEEHFREESATRAQTQILMTPAAVETPPEVELTDSRPQQWRPNRSLLLIIGASLLACSIVFAVWHTVGTEPAIAAATELDRIIARSSLPIDRTYQITVESTGEVRPQEMKRSPPPPPPPGKGRPSGPPPPVDGSILHVRGGRQFVFIRTLPDGRQVITGCNGKISWAIRPDEPVWISNDLDRFTQGIPGHKHSVPLINLQEGLSGLTGAYDIDVQSVDPATQQPKGELLRLFVADRKSPTHLGPRRIEISYAAATGLIKQMRFIDMPQARRPSTTLLLKLTDERDFGPAFFDHESHHEPDRAVRSAD